MQQHKTRIAALNSHPIQYFAPLYAYLNASDSLDITALYCSDFSLRGGLDPGFKQPVTWDVDLLSGYRSKFLGEAAKKRVPAGFWSLVCPEVWREIRSSKYDAVLLHGHGYAVNLIALVAAKSKGIKVMMRCDTHLCLKRSFLKRNIRRLVLCLLYKICDRCLAIGTANHEFYRRMFVPEEKIFKVPYTVDNKRFIKSSKITQEERAAIRSNFGLKRDQVVILYASKLDPLKHPDDLLRAAALLHHEGLECAVMMVGNGMMESQLHRLAKSLRLSDVIFPGFINQKDLPRILAACDIFVLPAENEAWGLIVNEAMCAGLPVVVGDEVGCVADLIVEGKTGFIHKPGNVAALAEALRKLVRDPALRVTIGQNCRARMEHWSFAECLQGIKAAVK